MATPAIPAPTIRMGECDSRLYGTTENSRLYYGWEKRIALKFSEREMIKTKTFYIAICAALFLPAMAGGE